MKNFVQPGRTVTLPAPYDRLSGQGALIGSLFGIANGDVLSGADGEFDLEGVFDHAKADSQAWAVGALIYWDNTAKVFTTNAASGANKLVGAAVLAVGSGAGLTTGRVRLNGTTVA